MIDSLKDYVAEKVAAVNAGPKVAIPRHVNKALGACEFAEWRRPDACEAIGLMRLWIQAAEKERLYRERGHEDRERLRAVSWARQAVTDAVRDYYGGDEVF